jgi:hypothetical protein
MVSKRETVRLLLGFLVASYLRPYIPKALMKQYHLLFKLIQLQE